MSVAFLFPGQGSQIPGMLHHLLDHPVVARTLDEISEALHSDVRNFDSEQCLNSDISVQIALLAAGVATARALMERGVQPAAVAGLSVGAFAAASYSRGDVTSFFGSSRLGSRWMGAPASSLTGAKPLPAGFCAYPSPPKARS